MEIWKIIEGYPNYVVSNLGRVKNILKDRLMTPTPVQKGGYLTVTIANKRKKLNRLVAMAFIPNPDNLPQVHHLDKDVKNNVVNNLAWITNAENNKTVNKNERKPLRRFSKEEVIFIHRKKGQVSCNELAQQFNCNIDSISKVWRGVGAKNKLLKEKLYGAN